MHALATGGDPRAGWLQVLAVVSVAAVLLAVAARLARSGAQAGRRLALGGAVAALALLAWRRGTKAGPARAGGPPGPARRPLCFIRATVIAGARGCQGGERAPVDLQCPARRNAERDAGCERPCRPSCRRRPDGRAAGPSPVRPRGDPSAGRRREHDRQRGLVRGPRLRRSTRDGSSACPATRCRRDSWTPGGHIVDLSVLLNVSESSNALTGAVHGSVT